MGVADALVSVASVVSVAIDIGYLERELALTWCLFLGGWCVLLGLFCDALFYIYIYI